ncbi:MAG: hypothetical protein SFU91_07050 [Chloroherpetonaceae bacterium]|nr:hypothetical protein [Chloroherpetonaceae bacterium]
MAAKKDSGKAVKKKQDVGFKAVKLIQSIKSTKTGQWRFAEKLVKVPTGADEAKFFEQEAKKINIL